MRNFPFSADERLLEAARTRPLLERTTLNQESRRRLDACALQEVQARTAMETIDTGRS